MNLNEREAPSNGAEDERTRKIFELISNENRKPEDEVTFSWDKVNALELNEFDDYRLFNFWIRTLARKTPDGLSARSLPSFDKAKMFSLSKPVEHLLNLTKSSKITQELKMPFEELYVSFDYKDEDMRLFGLHLTFLQSADVKEDNIKKIIENDAAFKKLNAVFNHDKVIITTLMFNRKINRLVFVDCMLDLQTGKILKKIAVGIENEAVELERTYQSKVDNIVGPFILNLFLFLNEPRVIIYEQASNNARRQKKGLIPLPSMLKTKIEIGLESYIEKIYFHGQSHSKLGFSFWVRGHWRTFVSPRFVNKQGQKTWILPHIRGEGIMPPQVFEVVTKNG